MIGWFVRMGLRQILRGAQIGNMWVESQATCSDRRTFVQLADLGRKGGDKKNQHGLASFPLV